MVPKRTKPKPIKLAQKKEKVRAMAFSEILNIIKRLKI